MRLLQICCLGTKFSFDFDHKIIEPEASTFSSGSLFYCELDHQFRVEYLIVSIRHKIRCQSQIAHLVQVFILHQKVYKKLL